MTLRISTVLITSLLLLVGCDDGDPSCICVGAVPEGELDIACGESACVGGTTGYVCTGQNQADFDESACFTPADAGPLTTDAGPAERDGAMAPLDGGPIDPPVDGGGCDMRLRYADGDGDGYGDPAGGETVCVDAAGYVDMADDCDDTRSAVHPGAAELCDAVDTDCDGDADPAGCDALPGTYTGAYEIHAEEKLGSTVINAVHCVGGTHSVTIDPAAGDPLTGTAMCSYSGSLSGFRSTQHATLTGTVAADGTVRGRLVHGFGPRDGSFSFEGAIVGGQLTIEGTGSYRPSTMSTVPWEVTYGLTPG